MKLLFLFSIFLQGAVITFDEFYFHWKRNLPRWERLGHPIDSFSLLLPIGLLAFANKTFSTETAFVALAILSCLCTTKDEWIHREHSSASENWLHSLLFILHPTVLLSGYFIWDSTPFIARYFFYAVLGFTLYQFIFWNFYADRIFKKAVQK